jgi:hypothetical protein
VETAQGIIIVIIITTTAEVGNSDLHSPVITTGECSFAFSLLYTFSNDVEEDSLERKRIYKNVVCGDTIVYDEYGRVFETLKKGN